MTSKGGPPTGGTPFGATGVTCVDFWAVLAVLMLNALVSAMVAWAVAGQRFGTLAFRVAEMEAAVEHYWDRIRKRTRVEPYDQPPAQHDATRQALEEIARRNGLSYIEPRVKKGASGA